MSSMLERKHPRGTVKLRPWNDSNQETSNNTSMVRLGDDQYEQGIGDEWQEGVRGPLEFVLGIWDQLKSHSAVCTLPSAPSIFSFSEQCIFFATVEFLARVPAAAMKDGGPPSVAVGCIYLATTSRDSEASIGIVLSPEYMGKGYGPLAINMLLEVAFEMYGFHRVCAVIPDHRDRAAAIRAFQKIGFVHEGTHRLAVTSEGGQWVDELLYSMLDTEWVFRHNRLGFSSSDMEKHWKLSPWEQLLNRQEREREALLLMDSKLKRSQSTETLRRAKHTEEMDVATDGETSMSEDDEPSSEHGASADRKAGESRRVHIKEEESEDSLDDYDDESYHDTDPFMDSLDIDGDPTPASVKPKVEETLSLAGGSTSRPLYPFNGIIADPTKPIVATAEPISRPVLLSTDTPVNSFSAQPVPYSPSTHQVAPPIILPLTTAPEWNEHRGPREQSVDGSSEIGSRASSEWDMFDEDHLSVRSSSHSEGLINASDSDADWDI